MREDWEELDYKNIVCGRFTHIAFHIKLNSIIRTGLVCFHTHQDVVEVGKMVRERMAKLLLAFLPKV